MVHTSLAEGVLHAAAAEDASLVLIGQHSAKAASALGTSAEAVAAATPVPVAIVIGNVERVGEVELVRLRDSQPNGARTSASRLAAELATRLGGSRLRTRDSSSESWSAELRSGQLCIAPAASWQLLAFSDPPDGAAVIIVLEPGVPLTSGQPPYADVLI